jgi:protein-glutamine gamma-glutamyltransferase
MHSHSSNIRLKLLIQLLFEILPTIFIGYFLLLNINEYYSILKQEPVYQAIYFGIGLISGFIFYQFRFRAVITTALLILLFLVIYKILENVAVKEFDVFLISIQFLLFCVLFVVGWVFGCAFQRISVFHIIISGLFLSVSIFIISHTSNLNFDVFVTMFAPIILYCLYIIFAHESIKNANWSKKNSTIRMVLKLMFFAIVISAIILSILFLSKKEVEAKIYEQNGVGKNSGNAVSQKDKNGDLQMSDAMKMTSSNKRNNELIFIAHIENYFDGSDIPNPLYLTAYHYTKFDSISETFERDSNMPSNDEFLPKPNEVPIYNVVLDSAKLINSKASKLRKNVEVEIYSAKMHKSMFLAPSTSYKMQPIIVEKNFQKEYKSAYRSSSMVSKLNSAYFIYNSNDETIQSFQEMRFNLLRKASNYSNVDSGFYKYYTHVPSKNDYAAIKSIADSLSHKKTFAIDKVLAVRDYFLQRDVNGNKIFRYSDNPGIPGLPSANKLLYFLTQNHKGYCAYYAGATLMLLRNMGVPCRIAVGFLTVDRSDKNKGWYWYYGDQAHAWVEVYFPEYGWIDFDTTIGNDEAAESESSDGTPPLIPEKTPLIFRGNIISNDTSDKIIKLQLDNIVLNEKNLVSISNNTIELNTSKAFVHKDTFKISASQLAKGEHIMAISYDKKLFSIQASSAEQLLNKINKPFSVDEILVQDSVINKAKKNDTSETKSGLQWQNILFWVLSIFIMLIILFLCAPVMVLIYYKLRIKYAKNYKQKSYFINNYILLYSNLTIKPQQGLTPLQYAYALDEEFGTDLNAFVRIYHKLKYSNSQLNEQEKILINNTLTSFATSIKPQITFQKKSRAYFSTIKLINYLINKK